MLQEVTMLDFLPSVVACCAIYVARKNMGRNSWSPTLEKYTKYHVEDLLPCLTEVGHRKHIRMDGNTCSPVNLEWFCSVKGKPLGKLGHFSSCKLGGTCGAEEDERVLRPAMFTADI